MKSKTKQKENKNQEKKQKQKQTNKQTNKQNKKSIAWVAKHPCISLLNDYSVRYGMWILMRLVMGSPGSSWMVILNVVNW